MCNSCVWGGITFPSFVGQSCCNPCCSGGSVSGESDSNGGCCVCFDCAACPDTTASDTRSTCGCCRRACGCQS